MSTISRVLGMFLKFIYDLLAKTFPSEPESISFFALSIIISTIIIKLVVLPINFSMVKNQKKMAELQPEIEKLQKKYKNDPQTLAAKQQKLYKEANYNILAGCLPMIIQMVVLIAFYRVFWEPSKYAFTDKAFFESINKNFFYIDSLEKVDKTMILAGIAALTTFLTSFLSMQTQPAQNEQSKSMMRSMMIIMPLFIFWMGRNFQSGLLLYWVVGNIFTVIQQMITNAMVSKSVSEEVK
ncbi:YidC/Oxa1 family membrane protein insertase [Peptoniphilus catoniae]|uniref:YidC/Oxa1 family membrane protein insertase n=1 Tax=Peptoniphilus catoniae TaxID=1660341 RepID=UPI0015D575B0|nr:YidC/Oxa1 family membrane protein insertase [Peptoniphilus catoniae]